ncbi:MAG: hypothetical protein KGY54_05610 [Oleiphilaceae bacterium]|nr:hypothetical protein [Oleiphilaceae bacterium]
MIVLILRWMGQGWQIHLYCSDRLVNLGMAQGRRLARAKKHQANATAFAPYQDILHIVTVISSHGEHSNFRHGRIVERKAVQTADTQRTSL